MLDNSVRGVLLVRHILKAEGMLQADQPKTVMGITLYLPKVSINRQFPSKPKPVMLLLNINHQHLAQLHATSPEPSFSYPVYH
jgi:hypothetical protein